MADKYDDDEPNIEDSDESEDEDIVKLSKTAPKKIKVVKLGEDDEDDDESDADSVKSSDEDNDSEANESVDEDFDQNEPSGQKADKSLLPSFPEFDESDGDEDEEEDDHYLQKFDENTKQNIVADFHPEMQAHNYEEVDIMSTVVRNENGIIIDPLHRTLPFITKYEKARILGERAKQLNSGAKPFIDVEPTVIDGYLIALKEYEQKKIPFILRRPLPNGGCEYWRMKDLEIL